MTAQNLLSSKPALHPVFREIAEISVQAEIDICNESLWKRARREHKKNFFPTSEDGMLLKTNKGEMLTEPRERGYPHIEGQEFHVII